MIEVFLYNDKWRIKIVNETLEFPNKKEFMSEFAKFIEIKNTFVPYKNDKKL